MLKLLISNARPIKHLVTFPKYETPNHSCKAKMRQTYSLSLQTWSRDRTLSTFAYFFLEFVKGNKSKFCLIPWHYFVDCNTARPKNPKKNPKIFCEIKNPEKIPRWFENSQDLGINSQVWQPWCVAHLKLYLLCSRMNARDFLRSVGKCFITSQLLLLENCLGDSSAKSANIYSAAATSARNAFHYSCCLTP